MMGKLPNPFAQLSVGPLAMKWGSAGVLAFALFLLAWAIASNPSGLAPSPTINCAP